MKRLCLILAMLFCLLLTGCGSGKSQKQFEEFSADIRQKDSLNFTADVRAEYDDHTAKFTLAYEGVGGNCSVAVIEPEILSGVTMRFENGKAVLDCSGISIDTGFLDESGLTPINALPLIVSAMGSGHLDSCAKDGECTVWYIIPADGITVSLWVNSGTLAPVRAELVSGGRVRIFCDFTRWD